MMVVLFLLSMIYLCLAAAVLMSRCVFQKAGERIIILVFIVIGVLISSWLIFSEGIFSHHQLAYLTCFFLLLFLSVEDICYKKLSIDILSGFTAGGLLLLILNPDATIIDYFLPGILLFGLIFLVNHLIKQSIGTGDGIVLFLVSLYLGWKTALFLLVTAMLMAGMTGIILLMIKKASRKSKLPFVPYLLSAFIVYIVLREL